MQNSIFIFFSRRCLYKTAWTEFKNYDINDSSKTQFYYNNNDNDSIGGDNTTGNNIYNAARWH